VKKRTTNITPEFIEFKPSFLREAHIVVSPDCDWQDGEPQVAFIIKVDDDFTAMSILHAARQAVKARLALARGRVESLEHSLSPE
jgi:hypothetical protein